MQRKEPEWDKEVIEKFIQISFHGPVMQELRREHKSILSFLRLSPKKAWRSIASEPEERDQGL